MAPELSLHTTLPSCRWRAAKNTVSASCSNKFNKAAMREEQAVENDNCVVTPEIE